MVDLLAKDSTPHQLPTLTELEAIRAGAVLAERRTVEWLMTSDETPNFEALLDQLVNRPARHQRAACRGMATEAFFPLRGVKPELARAVCDGCAVRPECLSAALKVGDRHGVWVGTTGRERRALRRGGPVVNAFVNATPRTDTNLHPTRPNAATGETPVDLA